MNSSNVTLPSSFLSILLKTAAAPFSPFLLPLAANEGVAPMTTTSTPAKIPAINSFMWFLSVEVPVPPAGIRLLQVHRLVVPLLLHFLGLLQGARQVAVGHQLLRGFCQRDVRRHVVVVRRRGGSHGRNRKSKRQNHGGNQREF